MDLSLYRNVDLYVRFAKDLSIAIGYVDLQMGMEGHQRDFHNEVHECMHLAAWAIYGAWICVLRADDEDPTVCCASYYT